MDALSYPLQKLGGYRQARDCILHGRSCQISGCLSSQLAHFINGLGDGFKEKVIVTFSTEKAKEIYSNLKFFSDDVVLYPSKDFIFFSADVHGSLIESQRLEFIQKVVEDKPFTVILTADAFMEKLAKPESIAESLLVLKKGSIIEISKLAERLTRMGYESVPQIDSPGQFAVRGNIVDVYTLTAETPCRIDFWDNEVDNIKSFEVESQRSIENMDCLTIYPASDYALSDDDIKKGVEKIKNDLFTSVKKLRSDFKTEEAHRLETQVENFLENLGIDQNGVALDGYVNYFCPDAVGLYDYFSDPLFFIDEPKRVCAHLESVENEFSQSMLNRLEKGYVLPGQTDILFDSSSVISQIDLGVKAIFTTIPQKPYRFSVDDFVEIEAQGINSYRGRFDMLLDDLKLYKKQGYSVLLVTSSETRGKRLAGDLLENGINAFFKENPEREVNPGEVMVIKGGIGRGFIYQEIKFAVISDTDIFGESKKKKRKRSGYQGTEISSLDDLSIGDYVVHESHGLGIYRGIEEQEVDHVVKDYVKIEYAKGGMLFVPATQMDVIQKYAGADTAPKKLNTLGGQEWAKTKGRVKRAVDNIAKELVELYAARQNGKGFQFSPDTLWQKEFEEMFPFEETQDQLDAIAEVKQDMESTKIMDRLICGDVGFGKTEVAIRAAFKAVQDNRQVAYLVPTTVLAQQHYKTFKQRFQDFPVRVEMLSRFRTKAETDQIIKDIQKGYVDIVIGTHRLLSDDVIFKDLGLLVIDEEQRFGVKHKEKIKEMKTNVDVITMTATPIPRTLHMSLIGVRDMCVMEEPPQDRMPIQTFVMEYDEETARDAINRELSRGGQVYYVYNKVQDIADMAAKLQKTLPNAVVAYAHGQMAERRLEDIMYDFVNGDIDVLVTTTIIETGLDIPNANTIIIHNAERMGLAQLYQLRGRVGRSNRTAYAFLMYSKSRMLSEVAEKRLEAIRDFTELGSGVKIAMRDLEIRGTGNLLGAEQSGQMEAVGYDLYCKMLNEAVSAIKEEKQEEDFETRIELNVDAFVPPNYIKNESLKMDVYKRIAEIENKEEYEDMQDELLDRFGQIPEPVENLLRIALLKSKAHKLYVEEVLGDGEKIKLTMRHNAKIDVERIPILVREYRGKLRFLNDKNPYFLYTPGGSGDVLESAEAIVESLSTLIDHEDVIEKNLNDIENKA